jgi:protein-S-isoprenylcysteine O-methyltransferase Ste14
MEDQAAVQEAERSIVETGISSRRRLLVSLIVPCIVLIAVPILILLTSAPGDGWATDPPQDVIVSFLGLVLLVVGLFLFVATVRLFSQHGEGSIMPWDPTRRLIVLGIYRHVRNPMHTGVFLVLCGEGLLLRSTPLLVFVAAAVVLHLFYIPLSEERGLERRFGEAYRQYKRNVPRWIPRLTPWEPESPQAQDCEQ